LRGGGARSHLTAKNHILCQLGHEHRILAPGPVAQSTASVEFLGGPALPYDPTYHLLWRIDKIRAAVRRLRPDVLEIHSPYVAAIACLSVPRRDFGIRTLFWHSDFIDTYQRVLLARIPRSEAIVRPLWGWVRAMGRACDLTIAASAHQQQKLIGHGVPDVELVPIGVDKEIFRPEARDTARRAALLGGDDTLLVAVGRFAVEKRWDVVLEAHRVLRERGARVALAMFGDGPERARLERLAGPGVRFYGFELDRGALASALASADALVHGCPHETFGATIAEAVVCGTGVVVPDQGGAGEQALGNRAARTYAAGDAEACASAIVALLEMGKAARREAAIEASSRVLTTRQHFERTLELYRDRLSRRARASFVRPGPSPSAK
jgi:alpha-1,6-mannosyltransferase